MRNYSRQWTLLIVVFFNVTRESEFWWNEWILYDTFNFSLPPPRLSLMMHFYTTKQTSRYLAWLSCFLPSSSYRSLTTAANVDKSPLRCLKNSVLNWRVLRISDSLYKSSILGGFFVSGTIPLFYELTVESTYPVAEGVTTGALTLINNSFTVIFLFVLMIPQVGKSSVFFYVFKLINSSSSRNK